MLIGILFDSLVKEIKQNNRSAGHHAPPGGKGFGYSADDVQDDLHLIIDLEIYKLKIFALITSTGTFKKNQLNPHSSSKLAGFTPECQL